MQWTQEPGRPGCPGGRGTAGYLRPVPGVRRRRPGPPARHLCVRPTTGTFLAQVGRACAPVRWPVRSVGSTCSSMGRRVQAPTGDSWWRLLLGYLLNPQPRRLALSTVTDRIESDPGGRVGVAHCAPSGNRSPRRARGPMPQNQHPLRLRQRFGDRTAPDRRPSLPPALPDAPILAACPSLAGSTLSKKSSANSAGSSPASWMISSASWSDTSNGSRPSRAAVTQNSVSPSSKCPSAFQSSARRVLYSPDSASRSSVIRQPAQARSASLGRSHKHDRKT